MTSEKFMKYSMWLTEQIWAAKCDERRNNKFGKLLIFFCQCEVVVGKNIRQQTCFL